jgi:hypothetical protein
MVYPPPPCPMCQSTNIGQPQYVGGLVLWYVCRACAYVWVGPPPRTPPARPGAAKQWQSGRSGPVRQH